MKTALEAAVGAPGHGLLRWNKLSRLAESARRGYPCGPADRLVGPASVILTNWRKSMPIWLWVTGLASDSYNDWIEVQGCDFRPPDSVDLTLPLNNLSVRIEYKIARGDGPSHCCLFWEPQTEYHLRESVFTSYRRRSEESVEVRINFTQLVEIYSGSP